MKRKIAVLMVLISLMTAGCGTVKNKEITEETPWQGEVVGVFEAENGTCTGNVIKKNDTVAEFLDDGDSCTIEITVAESGFYDLVFQLRSIGGYKENGVAVDEISVGVVKTDSISFQPAVLPRVYLEAGTHTVTLQKQWGWVEWDNVSVITSKPFDESVFEVSGKLSDPLATENAKRVFSYLCDTYGKKILSGQYIDNGRPEGWEIIKVVENNGNHFPAVLGLDLVRYSQTGIDHESTSNVADQAIDYWNKGGLVTICWHWMLDDSFVTKDWYRSFYTDQVRINLTDILNGKDEKGWELLRKDIHNIAQELLKMQDAGVPVLWRPLHEAAGKWFWWGSEGPETYKQLYVRLYKILTEEYGLHNLIWIWNGQDKDWYPGDAYVDMVGMDVYAGERVYTSQIAQFLENQSYADTNKMVVLSENGTVFDPELAVRDRAMWGFFCTWGGKHVMADGNIKRYSEAYTEKSMLRKAYESEYVVNREDLPDFTSYPIRDDAQ